MVEEEGADGAVEATGEEGEVGPRGSGWRWKAELGGDVAVVEVDLREGGIFLGVEAFGGIGVA